MNTIEVHDLVKSYKLYEKPVDRIKEAFLKTDAITRILWQLTVFRFVWKKEKR